MRRAAVALALALGLGGAACDGDAEGRADTAEQDAAGDATGDTGPSTEFAEGRSAYRLVITTELGQSHTVEWDITDDPTAFAFGSTHIAPAVSFGMTHNINEPATMAIGVNFGIVVGSDAHPVQTDGVGTYPFGVAAPGVEVFLNPLQYRSRIAGSEGTLVVTAFGTEPGDVVAGHFEGRILADVDGPSKKWADVQGAFHFILPERQQGQ